MKFRNLCKKLAPVVLLSGVAAPSFAAMDTADAVTAITDGGTAIAAIGVAVLAVVVALKMWKRLRGAA